MENNLQEVKEPEYRQFSFTGNGVDLFKIYIVNWLLTIITLGMYYPWAKATLLRYNYQHTFFEKTAFVFHGTGAEIFKGFIKVVVYVALAYGILIWAQLPNNIIYLPFALLLVYLVTFTLLPFAIHGSVRYRTSRSSWRGIHFGYRGQLKPLIKLYWKGILLTIVTFGFYGAWFVQDLRKYVIGNLRFGNISFEYRGKGGDYLWLNIAGYFLTIITLGIYGFWWMMQRYNFFVENTYATQNDRSLPVRSTAKGSDFMGLCIVNFLLVIFTLGLALPWVTVRTMNFYLKNLWIEGEFDGDNLTQTEENYNNATGDDMVDYLDLNLI